MSSTPAEASSPDNIPLAVGVIVVTVLALSLGDALIKFTSGAFAIWQIFVLRSCLALPVLAVYLAIRNPAALRPPPAIGWVATRSLMLVAMWLAYYIALPHLDLAAAAAAYYTLPIFITLFSALFIGEPVGRLGWVAVFVGFLGVLLILRPEAGAFNAYALLPLAAAVLYALAMILTRTKCREAHPMMLSIALNAAFILVGGAATAAISVLAPAARDGFLLAEWAEMGGAEWLSMSLLAAAILIGSVGAAIAYQNAPPAVIGTFDFAYVGFAVLWGVVFFAEAPDAAALLGMGLIVAAGIMSLRR